MEVYAQQPPNPYQVRLLTNMVNMRMKHELQRAGFGATKAFAIDIDPVTFVHTFFRNVWGWNIKRG
jgi:hypothetical protein